MVTSVVDEAAMCSAHHTPKKKPFLGKQLCWEHQRRRKQRLCKTQMRTKLSTKRLYEQNSTLTNILDALSNLLPVLEVFY